MKITNVSVDVVEHGHPARVPRIVPAGSPRRLRYTHEWLAGGKVGFEAYELFLRVRADDGVEGVCTCSSPELQNIRPRSSTDTWRRRRCRAGAPRSTGSTSPGTPCRRTRDC